MDTVNTSCNTSCNLLHYQKRHAQKIYRRLGVMYPNAHAELNFTNPFELLVATVLSAQTTDVRVNSVTVELFDQFPTPDDLAAADISTVTKIIKPVGFFRVKANSIIELSKIIVEKFHGEIPTSRSDLMTLPGVGKKTANVVLGNAFNIPGITVDTHFGRLARRFEWTVAKDPLKVESDVEQLFAPRQWIDLSHRLIFHGRRICHSRTPACGACYLAPLCPSYGIGQTEYTAAQKLVKRPERDHLLELAHTLNKKYSPHN